MGLTKRDADGYRLRSDGETIFLLIETPGEEAGRLREVTADELTRVAQGIFRPDRRSLVALGPCNSRVQRRVRRLLES